MCLALNTLTDIRVTNMGMKLTMRITTQVDLPVDYDLSPPPLQQQGVPQYPQHVYYDDLHPAMVVALQRMEDPQARIDAHHTCIEDLLLWVIRGYIQIDVHRGLQPLPIPER
ncbi:hypothetical protein HanIR_Chr04g0188631 [Helianthus annuus]|nr:hypothetical protein HanIR_Chr04g0188631 [Helianthus annuus]